MLLPGKQSRWLAVPTGIRQGQESHAYLGMCLLLPHKTVSGHPELGHACVPQVFDQCPDGVCFGNVVRSTEDADRGKVERHSVSLPGTGRNGCFEHQHWGSIAQQLVFWALPEDPSSTDSIHQGKAQLLIPRDAMHPSRCGP